jgi:nitrogen fixation NifU-like protein
MDFEEMDFAEKLQEEIIEEAKREYSEVIVDHWLNPRNIGRVLDADGVARVTGPCGDTMEIYLFVKNGKIVKCFFYTDGCGSSIACGSIVTTLAKGKRIRDARKISKERIIEYCKSIPPEYEHCALLASNTLHEAISNYERTKML